MTEKVKVRRSLISHVIQALWTLFAMYSAYTSHTSGKYIWGALFFISLAILIRITLKSAYMELAGSRLIIYYEFFQSRSIDIQQVDWVVVQSSPFSNSKFIMKDSSQVKFNYNNVNEKDFDALMIELKITVK